MNYIDENDIEGRNVRIEKANFELEKYDMYYVHIPMKNGNVKSIRVFCEKGTIPKFESELFKRYQKNYSKEISTFFVKRLFGKNGLIVKEGRDDYIYLGGEFLKNGYIANRNIIQKNGKTGQQNFNDNLLKVRIQVEARENKQQTNIIKNSGKHYIMGDIHGMYGSYIEAMEKLSNNDHIYIIGDVIDRGNGGIKIIQDIIKRQANADSNPQITFLLGNHEMQFIHTISIMVTHNLHRQDLINIMNTRIIKSEIAYWSLFDDVKEKKFYEEKIENYKQQLKKYEDGYNKIVKDKKLSEYELKFITQWLNSNSGAITMNNYFLGGRLKEVQEQNEIYTFLYNSYVILPQQINNKDYLLVHSSPPNDINMLNEMKQNKKGYKFSELSEEKYIPMLEERVGNYELAKQYGFTTVCGHTPEFGTIRKDEKSGYIRIDAGCGHKQKKSKLALYCIEDDKVEYIDEQEEEKQNII